MIFKKICYTLSIFILSSSLHAGSHENLVTKDFDKAIKHVEKKNYFEAFKIFSVLDYIVPQKLEYLRRNII